MQMHKIDITSTYNTLASGLIDCMDGVRVIHRTKFALLVRNVVLVTFYGRYVYNQSKRYYFLFLLHFEWTIPEMSDKRNKLGRGN